ncbi:MAG: amino acid racemase, partial [Clostridium sp.]|nr:amino acid racemase [Clostridium sp.]
MKKLGLVGGMGPESTVPYYRGIIYGVRERMGSNVLPFLSLESVDVFDIQRFCNEGRYDELTGYLLAAVRNLAAAGAEFAALSANTPHIVFDQLKQQTPIPLVSIIEAACEEAERRGLSRLGLMGTIFTMKGSFFKKPFEEKGIQVISPREEEMAYINEKIYTELEFADVREGIREGLVRIIRRMVEEDGIQAIILGCTELPLALDDRICPVPCLDTMKIH